jgi:hypothetical protein
MWQHQNSNMNTKISLSILVAALVLCLNANVVKAQELPLTVFPAVQDKEVKPGEKTRIQIQFRNSGSEAIPGMVKTADYTITDKQGTPRLIDDGAVKPKYGAAAWIKPAVDHITLPPNDFVTIDLFVTVPQDISTCGHYAVVYFQTEPKNIGQTIQGNRESASAITNKIGGLINFSTKSIKCKEDAQITNFTLPSFQDHGPFKVSFDIVNLSDVHITPQGVVMATDMLGKTVNQQVLKEQRIFPETAKSYNSTIGEKWMIGKYTVQVMTTYGTMNKRLVQSMTIIVFPWKEATVALLALLIIGLFVKKSYGNMAQKENRMEEKLAEEQTEIEKLKQQLRNRPE